jgi:phage FluMu protein Com
MQPVQFQCGHCGKLMAVSSQHIGQQVRCPHCQEIVIAPPPAAPTVPSAQSGEEKGEIGGVPGSPPGLAETVVHKSTPAGAAEDIFSSANAVSDLFSPSEPPRIEVPLESLPLTLPGDSSASQDPEATLGSPTPWAAQHAAAEPHAPMVPIVLNDKTAIHPEAAPPWPGGVLSEPIQLPPPSIPLHCAGEASAGSARAAKRTEAKAPWFLLLVFCPLLLYSIVISIFAFFIYRQEQQLQERLRNPFEMMPDVGDDPGVRKGKKVSLTDRYKPELATRTLPESLCTTLGKPLRVGDLQVTPNRIERQRLSVVVESARPEPCLHDSLVLYLDFKNLSCEYAFAPLDNYFDRYWRPGMDQIPPLTLLEVVGRKYSCYGGPANWHPRGDPNNLREWVKGRRDQADPLQPGEEKQMFVCTDGNDDKAAAVLFGEEQDNRYHGRFLWRVRVRRGLVRLQDKDYSATAVIGVRFTDSDIHQFTPEVH